jgi:signal transduction histidine kinase
VELVRQSIGEFEDKFVSHNLEAVLNIKNEPIYIMADGRSTYRIIENMFSNVNKYALSNTRVYVDIFTDNDYATVSIKNISATKLNINADELMGRFVRGDASRNTEGSGLGLSIAKSLAALQDATFDIDLDGDLFKAVIRFKKIDQYTQDKLLKKEVDTL